MGEASRDTIPAVSDTTDQYLEAQRRIEADMQAWTAWSDDQAAYLREHVWAMLATGKRDGSPQVSMIGYLFDDDGTILISAKAYTAKHRNAARQPKVALIVPDGAKQLVIYGTAEAIADDPTRLDLSAKLFPKIFRTPVDNPADLLPTLVAQQRTVLRITATRAFFQG